MNVYCTSWASCTLVFVTLQNSVEQVQWFFFGEQNSSYLYYEKKRLRQMQFVTSRNLKYHYLALHVSVLTESGRWLDVWLLCVHYSVPVGHHKRSWPPFKETLLMGENHIDIPWKPKPVTDITITVHDRSPNLLSIIRMPLSIFMEAITQRDGEYK